MGGFPSNNSLWYVTPFSVRVNVNPAGEWDAENSEISLTSSLGKSSIGGGLSVGGIRGLDTLTRREGGVFEVLTWIVGIGRSFLFRYRFFFPSLMYRSSKCKRHNLEYLVHVHFFLIYKANPLLLVFVICWKLRNISLFFIWLICFALENAAFVSHGW